MPKTADPLVFTLADFERVLTLWDCKLTEPVVHADGPPSIAGYPLVKRGLFAPGGQRLTVEYSESTTQSFRENYGDVADHHLVEGALSMVCEELNSVGFYGPSPKQALAVIRVFDALEAARQQAEKLA